MDLCWQSVDPPGAGEPPLHIALGQSVRPAAHPPLVPESKLPGAQDQDLFKALLHGPFIGDGAGAAPVQIGGPLDHDHRGDEGHGGGGPGGQQDIAAMIGLFHIGKMEDLCLMLELC